MISVATVLFPLATPSTHKQSHSGVSLMLAGRRSLPMDSPPFLKKKDHHFTCNFQNKATNRNEMKSNTVTSFKPAGISKIARRSDFG
eukprot:4469166-Amphidinium_carterae.1